MGPAKRVGPASPGRPSLNRRLQGCLRGSLRLSRYWGLTRQSLPPWCLESPCRPLVCALSRIRAARKAVSRILAPCRTTPIDFLARSASSTRISGEIERRADGSVGRDKTRRRRGKSEGETGRSGRVGRRNLSLRRAGRSSRLRRAATILSSSHPSHATARYRREWKRDRDREKRKERARERGSLSLLLLLLHGTVRN